MSETADGEAADAGWMSQVRRWLGAGLGAAAGD
jgi:hypothetical protein